jgi:hypothetical protein
MNETTGELELLEDFCVAETVPDQFAAAETFAPPRQLSVPCSMVPVPFALFPVPCSPFPV